MSCCLLLQVHRHLVPLAGNKSLFFVSCAAAPGLHDSQHALQLRTRRARWATAAAWPGQTTPSPRCPPPATRAPTPAAPGPVGARRRRRRRLCCRRCCRARLRSCAALPLHLPPWTVLQARPRAGRGPHEHQRPRPPLPLQPLQPPGALAATCKHLIVYRQAPQQRAAQALTRLLHKQMEHKLHVHASMPGIRTSKGSSHGPAQVANDSAGLRGLGSAPACGDEHGQGVAGESAGLWDPAGGSAPACRDGRGQAVAGDLAGLWDPAGGSAPACRDGRGHAGARLRRPTHRPRAHRHGRRLRGSQLGTRVCTSMAEHSPDNHFTTHRAARGYCGRAAQPKGPSGPVLPVLQHLCRTVIGCSMRRHQQGLRCHLARAALISGLARRRVRRATGRRLCSRSPAICGVRRPEVPRQRAWQRPPAGGRRTPAASLIRHGTPAWCSATMTATARCMQLHQPCCRVDSKADAPSLLAQCTKKLEQALHLTPYPHSLSTPTSIACACRSIQDDTQHHQLTRGRYGISKNITCWPAPQPAAQPWRRLHGPPARHAARAAPRTAAAPPLRPRAACTGSPAAGLRAGAR